MSRSSYQLTVVAVVVAIATVNAGSAMHAAEETPSSSRHISRPATSRLRNSLPT